MHTKLTTISHPQPNPSPLRKLNTSRLLIPTRNTQPIRHGIRARETINNPRPRLVRIRLKRRTPDHRTRRRTIRPGYVDAARRAAQRAVHGEDLDGSGSGCADWSAGGEGVGETAAPAASGNVEFDEHVFFVGAAGLLGDAEAGEVGGYWLGLGDAGDVGGDGCAAGGTGCRVDEREEEEEGGDVCEELHCDSLC
jgi:hypothetical protein